MFRYEVWFTDPEKECGPITRRALSSSHIMAREEQKKEIAELIIKNNIWMCWNL